jgi:hypothetical protein
MATMIDSMINKCRYVQERTCSTARSIESIAMVSFAMNQSLLCVCEVDMLSSTVLITRDSHRSFKAVALSTRQYFLSKKGNRADLSLFADMT